MDQINEKLYKIKEEYNNFFLKFKSLELSTVGDNGSPHSSYAPFVKDDKKNLFVYVSYLANHTKNLINDGRAGVMFIESEEKAENVFVRKRVIFECEASPIPKNSKQWEIIMEKFEENFGNIMKTLIMLSDFELLILKPISGRFIKGFGNAYEICGDTMDQLLHINYNKNNTKI